MGEARKILEEPPCWGGVGQEHDWCTPRELDFGDTGGGVTKRGDVVTTVHVCKLCGTDRRTSPDRS
jgi:hypothetical protein